MYIWAFLARNYWPKFSFIGVSGVCFHHLFISEYMYAFGPRGNRAGKCHKFARLKS